jgi:hypothetical protein
MKGAAETAPPPRERDEIDVVLALTLRLSLALVELKAQVAACAFCGGTGVRVARWEAYRVHGQILPRVMTQPAGAAVELKSCASCERVRHVIRTCEGPPS